MKPVDKSWKCPFCLLVSEEYIFLAAHIEETHSKIEMALKLAEMIATMKPVDKSWKCFFCSETKPYLRCITKHLVDDHLRFRKLLLWTLK